jgi:ABC-type multidrug transport system fused ATPase/permease subunit
VLMVGRTTIAIAHRLSTIMQMDRIIVLDGGKIVDEGTHTQLLQRGGLYQRLWNIQAGGFAS